MARPPIIANRDVYANLLRDSRGMRRDHEGARSSWFAGLSWERKEETLFELEMLLKGLACFGNVRNQPGRQRSPEGSEDYQEELRVVRDALGCSVNLVRQLLGPRDRAFVFSRYLETVLPEDTERSRLIKEQLSQDTPEESLFVLRNTLAGYLEIADGIARLPRVSPGLYQSLLGMIVREVGRSTFFNPLVALEFRPEFDRIRDPTVLEALSSIESEAAHRVAALSYLTLFRCLRYVRLIEEYATEPGAARRAYVILAVLRSDLRALTRYLSRRSADAIAGGLERDLLKVHAADIDALFDDLASSARGLLSLRSCLESVASALRVEVRQTFERDLPPPRAGAAEEVLSPALVVAAASVRASVHHAARTLSGELRPDAAGPELAWTAEARRGASDRLRRDVWMFSQVLRAFLAKARATSGDPDRWAGYASFHFVREFLRHFRAIGYQLVRSSDYPRLDRFMAALEGLRDVDLLDPDKLRLAIDELGAFQGYLAQLFEKVSLRSELQGVPFDKRAAADTLRIYLGAA